jgi:hypothetical protein
MCVCVYIGGGIRELLCACQFKWCIICPLVCEVCVFVVCVLCVCVGGGGADVREKRERTRENERERERERERGPPIL